MELGNLVAIWLRRLPLIALCGLLSGVGTWLLLRDSPKVYEQQLSFAVRPSDRVTPENSARVAAAIANRESAIIQTIVGLLDSSRVPQATARANVERNTTLRPGSAIIDVSFRGEDPAAVGALAQEYLAAAPQLIARSYRIFQLETLSDGGRPEAVPSKIWRAIALAVLLGCALGMAAATLEQWVRNRRARVPVTAQQGPAGELILDDADRIDRIEAAMREGLGPGQAVVRAGPTRLVVVEDEPAPTESSAAES